MLYDHDLDGPWYFWAVIPGVRVRAQINELGILADICGCAFSLRTEVMSSDHPDLQTVCLMNIWELSL